MHLNSRRRQTLDLGHKAVVVFDAQQRATELRIGGMHRNVQRREPLFDDPLHFGLTDVGQRQVISKQKRQPIILVLDVQRSADVFRILMDETKHALVLASHRFDRFELQTKRFPFPADERDLAVLRLNRRAPPDVAGVELKIDHIEQRFAVQLMNLIAGFQADTLCHRAGFDTQDAQLLSVRSAMRRRIPIFVYGFANICRRGKLFLAVTHSEVHCRKPRTR